MKKQIIIAIGREFGSGGHYIGETLAKRLGINFYDRNLLDEIAKEKGVSGEKYRDFEERKTFHLTRHVRGHSSSVNEILAEMQFDYIKNKAKSGESFVIVGRCAESVLKDNKNLIPIFVLGDTDAKVKRTMEVYNVDKKEAASKCKRHDKNRKAYHNTYSDIKWGDSRGYDLCINSTRLGVDGTVDYIENYINSRIEKM